MRFSSNPWTVLGVALLIVAAAVSPPGADVIEDTTGIETVGEADGIAVTTAALVAGGAGVLAGGAACYAFCGGEEPESIEEEAAEANQFMISVYSSLNGLEEQAGVGLVSIHNRLEDSTTVAKVDGTNEAILEMNNDTTQIKAEQAARGGVEDYYSRIELSVIDSWNVSAAHIASTDVQVRNETGVDGSYASNGFTDLDGWYSGTYDELIQGTEPVNVTLQNGTQTKVLALVGGWGDKQDQYHQVQITPWTGEATFNGDQNQGNFTRAIVRAGQIDGEDYSTKEVMDFSDYGNTTSRIETLTTETSSSVVQYINNSYGAYQVGDVNDSDLIDPYIADRHYDPGDDYQSWVLAQQQRLGLNQPLNLSTVGWMEVTTDGVTVRGILMAESPPADGFQVNQTYNASQLAGPVQVVGNQTTWDIQGEFTLDQAVTKDGEQVKNVTYQNITYVTSDTSDVKAMYENLSKAFAEQQAREEAAGGGGLFDGQSQTAIVIGALGAAALIAGRRRRAS